MSATSSRPVAVEVRDRGREEREAPGPLGEARNGLAGAAIPGVQRRGVRRQDHSRDAVAGDVGQRRRADEGEALDRLRELLAGARQGVDVEGGGVELEPAIE